MEVNLTQRFNDVWASGAIRILTMGVSSASSVYVTKLLFNVGGIDTFSLSALLVTLSIIVPFLSLGIGPTITNLFARSSAKDLYGDRALLESLLTSFRILALAGVGVSICSVVFYKIDFWHFIFGKSLEITSSRNLSFTIAFIMIGLSLPLSLGNSILVGKRKNYLSILALGISGPISLIWVLSMSRVGLDDSYLALGPGIGIFASVALSWYLASRSGYIPHRFLLRNAFRIRKNPGRSIASSAIPMTLILVSLTITLQSDKLILARTSTLYEVAIYAVTAQILSPTLSIMGVLTTSFWPHLTKLRAEGNLNFNILLKVIGLVLIGTSSLISLTFLLLSTLEEFLTNSTVHIDPILFILFGMTILAMMIHSTVSYSLNDDDDLKFQAKILVIMSPLNICLSWYLSIKYGALGPLLGTLFTLPTIVIIPNLVRAKRLLSN